jgi:predicted Zn-dependent protease
MNPLFALVVAAAAAAPAAPRVDPSKELSAGVAAAEAGDLPTAKTHLQAAHDAAPTWGVIDVELADVLLKLGTDGPEVEKLLADAQKQVPENPRMWRLLGSYREQKSDAAGAAEAYEKSLALRPDEASTHFHLAGVLQGLGKTEEAIAQYRAVTALDPHDSPSKVALADLYTSEGALASAEDQLRALVADNPNNALYQQKLNDVLTQEGKAPKPKGGKKKRPLLPSKK